MSLSSISFQPRLSNSARKVVNFLSITYVLVFSGFLNTFERRLSFSFIRASMSAWSCFSFSSKSDRSFSNFSFLWIWDSLMRCLQSWCCYSARAWSRSLSSFIYWAWAIWALIFWALIEFGSFSFSFKFSLSFEFWEIKFKGFKLFGSFTSYYWFEFKLFKLPKWGGFIDGESSSKDVNLTNELRFLEDKSFRWLSLVEI